MGRGLSEAKHACDGHVIGGVPGVGQAVPPVHELLVVVAQRLCRTHSLQRPLGARGLFREGRGHERRQCIATVSSSSIVAVPLPVISTHAG